MKKVKNEFAACRNALAGGEFSLPALSTPNFRFGQTENVQNSPSENIPKTQKNPAEINRFQPDLVGVSGFEPEASWSRRLVGYFSRAF